MDEECEYCLAVGSGACYAMGAGEDHECCNNTPEIRGEEPAAESAPQEYIYLPDKNPNGEWY